MKKNNFIYIITLFFLSNFLIPTSFSFAESANGINVNLDVNGCNKNGICEVGQENFLTCPEDCTPEKEEGGSTGGSIPVDQNNLFQNFSVVPSYTSAIIKWDSYIPTIFILKWGENNDYKNGNLKNTNFVNNHSVEITGLKSNTLYYFTIETQTYLGKIVTIGDKTFTTTTPPDYTPPLNPTGIIASSVASGITLSWTNPPDKDFAYIRVVRSTERYQSSPYLGKLVYEGSGQYLRDSDVKSGVRYYYTLFARDKSGNFSSGSMEDLIYTPPDSTEGQVFPKPPEPEIEVPITAPALPTSYTVEQNGVIKDFSIERTVAIEGDKISIVVANFNIEKPAYDMWIEIKDKNNKVEGRYFFSDEKDDNDYKEVIVPAIRGGGVYDVLIFRHYDGNIELIHKGVFDVTALAVVKEKVQSVWLFPILMILIIILLLILFCWFIRKIFTYRKKKKEREFGEILLKEIKRRE